MALGTLAKSPGEVGVQVPGGLGVPLGCSPRPVGGFPGLNICYEVFRVGAATLSPDFK